jgi:hypothetical protein
MTMPEATTTSADIAALRQLLPDLGPAQKAMALCAIIEASSRAQPEPAAGGRRWSTADRRTLLITFIGSVAAGVLVAMATGPLLHLAVAYAQQGYIARSGRPMPGVFMALGKVVYAVLLGTAGCTAIALHQGMLRLAWKTGGTGLAVIAALFVVSGFLFMVGQAAGVH